MLSVTCLLAVAGFVAVVAAVASPRVPLWLPVLPISLAQLLGCLPLR